MPFTYTGEQLDRESGLVYLRARYMDPATGRFQSKDPFEGRLADPVSLQTYMYAKNRPGLLVDPSGMFPGGGVIHKVQDAATEVVSDAGQLVEDHAGDVVDVVLDQALDNPVINPLAIAGIDGWCAAGSFGGVGSGSASGCLVRTEDGSWSLTGSLGGGGWGNGGSIGVGPAWTNASNPCELAGNSGAGGAEGGAGWGGGVGANIWPDADGGTNYVNNLWSGWAGGFSAAGGGEHTRVWSP